VKSSAKVLCSEGKRGCLVVVIFTMLSHVYLEQQVSALCGRQAVNNLLQGPYVNEIDLAQIAQELDEIEQNLMLQDRGIGGEPTVNALRFVANFESSNVDDSGNFSVTVLKEALNRWGKVDLTTEKELVEKACAITPGLESPTISPLQKQDWVAVRAMVLRKETNQVMDELWAIGGRGILVTDIHACRL
jgi:ATP phosphoribosyltransferase-like protein